MTDSLLDALTTTPVTKKALADKLGTSTRDVEQAVNEARLRGVPICSDGDGYWIGTASEAMACSKRLQRRAVHQMVTSRALRKAARRLEGVRQEPLW